MKANLLIIVGLSVMIVVLGNNASAQQQNFTHTPLTKEDSSAINALVLYPDTIRLDIFEACEYPAAIVTIASIQKNSSDEFAKTISSYSKDEQEDLWDLGRYPDLISKLAQGGKKSEEEINAITTGYPDEVRKNALKYGRRDYDVLQRIDNLQQDANRQFEQTIADYPDVTKDAFRELIGMPEVMNLLNDHLNLTVRVGDRYRRDPQRVIHRADSMNLVAVRQNAEEVQAWKDSVQQNPDMMNDLKGAAQDYAKENGYSQDEIATPSNPQYVDAYVSNPYSYWFGYPSWYPYHYWYPHPYWYDCGFYYDAFGNMVVIGMPSYYFTNWYFYYPYYWQHYPYLGCGYVNHYYGPRRVVSTNALVVRSWVNENRQYLPRDFTTNRRVAADAIRQVGQLNVDAVNGKRTSPVSPAARDQYFTKNSDRYPALNSKAGPRMQPEATGGATPYVREQPTKQPAVRIPPPAQQQQPQPRQQYVAPAQPQRSEPAPQHVEPARPAAHNYNYQNMNKAQDYHRNTWSRRNRRRELSRKCSNSTCKCLLQCLNSVHRNRRLSPLRGGGE